MSMIQIRNVPEALHRKLKVRAAMEGLSLSDFLLREIERTAARPSPEELAHRLEGRAPVHPSAKKYQKRGWTAAMLREERNQR